MIYDTGRRIDGKINVWRMRPHDGKHVIVQVCKDDADAADFIEKKLSVKR